MQIGDIILPTIWVQIKNFPKYEVSICGQVRNFKTKIILKPCITNGYYCVSLAKTNTSKTQKIQCKTQRVHRLVLMNFIPNIEKCECIDHINNNRLDNTISNLRWCTQQQNNFNRSLNLNSTSKVKGVVWINDIQRWRALIHFNNKTIDIGSYTNIEDAKNARQEMAQKLFGDFIHSSEK